MTWHRVLGARGRAMFQGRRIDSELDDELRSHIEMETEENLKRGMSPKEARRKALLEFGGLAQMGEGCDGSKRCFRMCATRCGGFGRLRGLPRWPSCRSPSASASIP